LCSSYHFKRSKESLKTSIAAQKSFSLLSACLSAKEYPSTKTQILGSYFFVKEKIPFLVFKYCNK